MPSCKDRGPPLKSEMEMVNDVTSIGFKDPYPFRVHPPRYADERAGQGSQKFMHLTSVSSFPLPLSFIVHSGNSGAHAMKPPECA